MIVSNQTILAGLLAFLTSPIGFAQSPENSDVKNEETAPEKIVDTVSLLVDFEKRPDDEGGNLFLVGFKEVDENNMPISGSQPDDFQQIGVWVRTWPFEKEISVVRGLHYMGLYGYSEYPSDTDLTTKTVQHTESNEGVLRLIVYENIRASQDEQDVPEGTPPIDEMVVEKIPPGIQEVATTINVQFDPAPEKLGGKVFLTGFEQFDPILGLPQRNAEPIHFLVLNTNLEGASLSAEVQLQKGLGYIAMYGWGDHPEAGDRMGKIIHYKGDETLQLNIGSNTVGTVPKGAKTPEAVAGTPGDGNATQDAATTPEDGRSLLLPLLLLAAVLGALGTWRIQRKKGETDSQLERVGESDSDS